MPGVGLMVRVVGLGLEDPEFKSHLAVELTPGGVDFARHPSKVGKMSCSMLCYRNFNSLKGFHDKYSKLHFFFFL